MLDKDAINKVLFLEEDNPLSFENVTKSPSINFIIIILIKLVLMLEILFKQYRIEKD